MGNTPLKLNDANGNLKEMTTAEENYLAYQAGLYMSEFVGVANPGMVSTTSTGATSIGSFTNTFFNEAIGTHPGSSISSGSTTSTLYLYNTSASETGIVRPLQFDNTLDGIQQMDDTDWNACIDRILSTAMTNEYPGHFRIATSAPAGYSAWVNSVFTDTRTDGTSTVTNLYRRTSITAPTAVRPMKLKSTSPIQLQEMTDAEIKANFGKRMANRIVSSVDNIGWYQLRSSAQGAPVAAGTWAARGTATDTKNTTSDVNYTRISTRDTIIDYTQNFTQDFLGDFLGDYTGNFIGDTNFTRISTRDRLEDFLGDFLGDYIGNFIGDTNFTRISTRDTLTDFTGNFLGDYLGNFIGDTNFTRISTRVNSANYTRICAVGAHFPYPSSLGYPGQHGYHIGYPQGHFSTFATQWYAGNFIGDFLGNFLGDFVGTRDYTRISTRDNAIVYTGNFLGDYTGDFVGVRDYTQNFTRNTVTTFTGNFLGDYTGDFIGVRDYTRISTRNSTNTFTGDFIGNFLGNFLGNYTGDYLGETIGSGSTTIETYTLYVRTA